MGILTSARRETRWPGTLPEPAPPTEQREKQSDEVGADAELGDDARRQGPQQEEDETTPRIDPLALSLSNPMRSLGGAEPEVAAASRALDPMVQEILQAVAWGGDKKRGAARLELGGKRYGGASVTVSVEGENVTLQITGPSHGEAHALGERLLDRLEKRGLRVTLNYQ